MILNYYFFIKIIILLISIDMLIMPATNAYFPKKMKFINTSKLPMVITKQKSELAAQKFL
ncbi:MAG: hypothetical protein V1855_02110 [bacterium]